jgi:hypothetical protein
MAEFAVVDRLRGEGADFPAVPQHRHALGDLEHFVEPWPTNRMQMPVRLSSLTSLIRASTSWRLKEAAWAGVFLEPRGDQPVRPSVV